MHLRTFAPSHSTAAAASAAVVDIGSNSIKVLVAKREATGQVVALKLKTIDARLSAGISREAPRLSAEAMARGIEAVVELLADAAVFAPTKIVLVATSAVRDALNGGEFTAGILARTGQSVRILTGEEEANYIGRGLTCDPALRGLRDFYVFDLGGGSLECLSFRDRRIVQAISLPLGCVRLTERWVRDSTQALSQKDREQIATFTRETLAQSGFKFDLPANTVAVGTGGTLTTARAILAGMHGKSFDEEGTLLTKIDLQNLFAAVASVDLVTRKKMNAMPAARADVLPTALATIIAVAEFGGLRAYQNSLYNLRWGIADEALE